MRKAFPLAVTSLVVLAFGLLVRQIMRLNLPESDLWWMMPAMHTYTAAKSAGEVFYFLMGPLPVGFAQPILKLYLYAVAACLGPEIRWFIGVSSVLHAISTGLLVLLGRQLGLSRRESGLSGILYFSAVVHFHVVLWPTASQHLVGVLTILLLLVLYLKTEERITRGIASGGIFAATMAAGLAASLQRSTVIAPILILVHLIFCSKDHGERVRRYLRWAPLACIYVIYPVWVLTQAGDPVITEVIRKLPLPEVAKTFLVTDPVVPNPVPSGVRTLAVWMAALVGVGLGSVFLRAAGRVRIRRNLRVPLVAAACAGLYFFWAHQDSRQLLLPYNLITPLMASLAGLLEPFRAVLSIRSTEAFHYLPAQVSPWSLLLTLAAVWFFWKVLLPRNRSILLLPAWLLVAVLLTIHQNSSFPLQTPSRYFSYFSPVACLLLAPLMAAFFDRIAFRSARPWVRDRFLFGFVGLLGLCNLAAVGVAMFRGRLANTYLAYNDLRIVRLVEQDRSSREEVWVSGILPMPIREQWVDFPLAVPENYDNLFFMARSASGISTIHGLHAGESAPRGRMPEYRVDQNRLLRRDGENADPFARRMEQGIRALREGDRERARELLIEAARIRPFLLRYLLGPLRLLDTVWLTDGLDLQDWLNRVHDRHVWVGNTWKQKAEQNRAVASQELSDYALCLLLISYLDHRRGEKAESQYWFSQIQFLDRDPARLIARLDANPSVRTDPGMRKFLREKAMDPFFFIEPYFWKKEDYSFGRFLLRLLTGRDIRSSWDTRFGVIL